MRRSIPTLAFVTLTLAGCAAAPTVTIPVATPTPEPVTVSAACAAALDEFGKASAEGEQDALLVALNACSTVEEYLLGVHENPASWWFKDEESVNDEHVLFLSCNDDVETPTPVCVDAAAQGLLD